MFTLKEECPEYFRYQGRRISKKLSDTNVNLLNEHYNKHTLDKKIIDYYKVRDVKKKINFNNSNFSQINLEIGFGDGEYLLRSACSRPKELFIGVDVYVNGIAKVLKKILEHGIENIILSNINCLFFLDSLSSKSIDNITIINPDPWTKKKHHKRRLISFQNIQLFNYVTKYKHSTKITTDSESYVESIKEIFHEKKEFLDELKFETLNKNDELYGISRYQRKAIEKGQKIYLLTI